MSFLSRYPKVLPFLVLRRAPTQHPRNRRNWNARARAGAAASAPNPQPTTNEYPPDGQDAATQTVLDQAKELSAARAHTQ